MAEYGRWYVKPSWIGEPVQASCQKCHMVVSMRVDRTPSYIKWYFHEGHYAHGSCDPLCLDCSGVSFSLLDEMVNG